MVFCCCFFLEVVVEDDVELVVVVFWVIVEDFCFEGVELVVEDCGEVVVRWVL